MSLVEMHGHGDSGHQVAGSWKKSRLLREDGMLDMRGVRYVASAGYEDRSVHGATKASTAARCELLEYKTEIALTMTLLSQPPPVIETFDDEKIPDDKDHKRDRDVSFSMAALPIPLGPLGGLSSLAGLI